MNKSFQQGNVSMQGLHRYLDRKHGADPFVPSFKAHAATNDNHKPAMPKHDWSGYQSFASVPITKKDVGRYHPPIDATHAVNYGRGKGPAKR